MKDSDYDSDYKQQMGNIAKAKEAMAKGGKKAKDEYGRVKTNYHRRRQKLYYKVCSQHLIQQNKSWTSFHDTDEFLTFTNEQGITTNPFLKMQQPGYILNRLNSIKEKVPSNAHVNETGVSCLIVDRRQICAKELSTEETNDLFSSSFNSTKGGMIIPEGFMNSSVSGGTDSNRQSIVRKFDTLRYKYLTDGIILPKSFIDLSQPNPKLYAHKWINNWSVHKVMISLCEKEQKSRLSELKSMVKEEHFTINHYLGTFQAYSVRDDARQGGIRSYEKWKGNSNKTRGEQSIVVRPWIKGFVNLVGGLDIASYLLQDAGRFPNYNAQKRIEEYKKSYDYRIKKGRGGKGE